MTAGAAARSASYEVDAAAEGLRFTVNVDGDAAMWGMVPERYRAGLDRWITDGIRPGDFLCAVLANDLQSATHRSDDRGLSLKAIVSFLNWNAPPGCYGSREKFESWGAHQGLKGRGHG